MRRFRNRLREIVKQSLANSDCDRPKYSRPMPPGTLFPGYPYGAALYEEEHERLAARPKRRKCWKS